MHFICGTCGTQYRDTPASPAQCPICEDERQYVGLSGQQWTTLNQLRQDHRVTVHEEALGILSLTVEPHFAIGQRAFLLQTSEGNLLWDCIALLDEPTIECIASLGRLKAICISHPHYYTTMVEWSRAFNNAPVYLHRDDAQWVMRPDPCIHFWEGETKQLFGGLTAIRCGGHFDGAAVLHWLDAPGGQGALFSGDTIQVVPDRRFVSFMRSYPNLIPLNATAIQKIVNAVEPFPFHRIYGAFPKMTVSTDGKNAVRRSAERYLNAIRAAV
ncbi:MAG TPA: hypothetical protein VLJ11_19895 [Bryobacteraceae bacterium]|nr:hypothetical protein [Bryobacteraceae bacterium]